MSTAKGWFSLSRFYPHRNLQVCRSSGLASRGSLQHSRQEVLTCSFLCQNKSISRLFVWMDCCQFESSFNITLKRHSSRNVTASSAADLMKDVCTIQPSMILFKGLMRADRLCGMKDENAVKRRRRKTCGFPSVCSQTSTCLALIPPAR